MTRSRASARAAGARFERSIADWLAQHLDARTDLAGWIREAHLEARNDDARIGVVVAKRRGTTDPAEQWVHMTLADLAWLLGADHPTYDE